MNRITRALGGNSKGIGLIETIIALAILGIIAVAFLSALAGSLNAARIADQRATALSLAQSQMEYVKNQTYSTNAWDYTVTTSSRSSSTQPEWWEDSPNEKPPLLPDEYSAYCVKAEAVDFDVDGDGSNDEGIRKITITVYSSDTPVEDDKIFTLEDYKVDR